MRPNSRTTAVPLNSPSEPTHLSVRPLVTGHIQAVEPLDLLCEGFEQLTGYKLRYCPASQNTTVTDPLWSAPVNPGVGETPGRLMIGPDLVATTRLDWQSGIPLAKGVAALLGELEDTRRALVCREAELAVGVPVVRHPEEGWLLAERLQAVLKTGAQAIDADAAGLYLLDAATTELKLRACWNLPSRRLLDRPRSLKSSIADLEALTGHAVALENELLMESWNVPEVCGAALCVPVSTPSTLLGTLWLFNKQPRDFTDGQTSLAEIIAGRVAADLERDMLLAETEQTLAIRRELKAAQEVQRAQIPESGPEIPGWDLGGWLRQAGLVGGNFIDWFWTPDGELTFCLGETFEGTGPASAIVAATVRSALEAHSQHANSVSRILDEVNRTVWAETERHKNYASAMVGKLKPETGELRLAIAGRIGALRLGTRGFTQLGNHDMPLAVQQDTIYREQKFFLEPGSTLVLYSSGLCECWDDEREALGEEDFAQWLWSNHSAPAQELARSAGDLLLDEASDPQQVQGAVLVLRRPAEVRA